MKRPDIPSPTGARHLRFWEHGRKVGALVYVIQGRLAGPIKIGTAMNVRSRIAGLQTGNPDELRLLYVLAGRPNLERQLHQRFARERVRGEWFAPAPEMIALIADLADDLVEAANDYMGQSPYVEDLKVVPEPPDYDVEESDLVKRLRQDMEPRMDPAEAQALRASMRGLSREMYLGPVDRTVFRPLGIHHGGTGGFSKS